MTNPIKPIETQYAGCRFRRFRAHRRERRNALPVDFKDLDLARRDGDDVVAVDLADVAAWLAEELDQQPESGDR